jgi:hypothetical protein
MALAAASAVQSAAGKAQRIERETVYHNDDVDVAVLVRRKGTQCVYR